MNPATTSDPEAALTSKSANSRSAGGRSFTPSMPLWSRTHRAREERRPLVALAEALRPNYAVGEHGGCLHGIVHVIDGRKRSFDAFEIVGLVEPLVVLANGAVELHGERERGAPQWSWR